MPADHRPDPIEYATGPSVGRRDVTQNLSQFGRMLAGDFAEQHLGSLEIVEDRAERLPEFVGIDAYPANDAASQIGIEHAKDRGGRFLAEGFEHSRRHEGHGSGIVVPKADGDHHRVGWQRPEPGSKVGKRKVDKGHQFNAQLCRGLTGLVETGCKHLGMGTALAHHHDPL